MNRLSEALGKSLHTGLYPLFTLIFKWIYKAIEKSCFWKVHKPVLPLKLENKAKWLICDKRRTTDHIHTLHSLIHQHVHQNKNKIFSCFVDFRKAFDSIWHDDLFLKLLVKGAGGKVYNIIKTMYTQMKWAVKVNNMETDFFPQSRGVKQGCSLSPTLFNIYIDELA